MHAPTVPNVCTAKQVVLVVFVKKENLPVALMVLRIRKAVLQQPANAGQKQKKEQDVPVIKGLVVIAGSMADRPWNCITTTPHLLFCKVAGRYYPKAIL
jgi:hypothetical protein